MSAFPHWIYFSVPLATWRAAPGGVDEDQICGWCGVCCCISGWWAEQMTMNCISPNEAQISIYIIYMLLLSATNLCLCQHRPVVYGPILEQVQCKMMNMSTDWWWWWWWGCNLVCDWHELDKQCQQSAVPGSQHQPPRGAGLYLDTWTRYLVYILLHPIGWCEASH